MDCLTKTNPYVAIHRWKALSLSIDQGPLKIIFIKGPVSKLGTYKDLSVYHTFVFESAGFLQSIVFSIQCTLKDAG